jgi:hypothetical protein
VVSLGVTSRLWVRSRVCVQMGVWTLVPWGMRASGCCCGQWKEYSRTCRQGWGCCLLRLASSVLSPLLAGELFFASSSDKSRQKERYDVGENPI